MKKAASTFDKILNRIVFSILVLILLCLGACLVATLISPLIHFPPSDLEIIASRLGFEPSINGLAEYINTSVKPGMTRSEVDQILSEIGEIECGERRSFGMEVCDDLLLKIPGERTIYLVACYGSGDTLVSMDAPPHDWNSNPPAIKIPVPKRQ
jgi:hypothetical protein